MCIDLRRSYQSGERWQKENVKREGDSTLKVQRARSKEPDWREKEDDKGQQIWIRHE